MERMRFMGWLWKRWRDHDGALLKYHRDDRRRKKKVERKQRGGKQKAYEMPRAYIKQ